jgi:hypothetical protein
MRSLWRSVQSKDAPVKKFKDRTTATTRIWKSIQDLGEATKPKVADPAQPKAERKAKGGTQSAKGAPTKGKATKKGHRRQERAQGQTGRQDAGSQRAARR